jgi:hypothetical protein
VATRGGEDGEERRPQFPLFTNGIQGCWILLQCAIATTVQGMPFVPDKNTCEREPPHSDMWAEHWCNPRGDFSQRGDDVRRAVAETRQAAKKSWLFSRNGAIVCAKGRDARPYTRAHSPDLQEAAGFDAQHGCAGPIRKFRADRLRFPHGHPGMASLALALITRLPKEKHACKRRVL